MICKNCNTEIVGMIMDVTLDALEHKDKKTYKCLNCNNEIDHIAAAKDYAKTHAEQPNFLVRIVNKMNNTNLEAK